MPSAVLLILYVIYHVYRRFRDKTQRPTLQFKRKKQKSRNEGSIPQDSIYGLCLSLKVLQVQRCSPKNFCVACSCECTLKTKQINKQKKASLILFHNTNNFPHNGKKVFMTNFIANC